MLDKSYYRYKCPGCDKSLSKEKTSYSCKSCKIKYPITHGIPQLFYPNEWNSSQKDVTERIKEKMLLKE